MSFLHQPFFAIPIDKSIVCHDIRSLPLAFHLFKRPSSFDKLPLFTKNINQCRVS
ncbi:hypothetical protein HanPSC8_Chr07g0306311 [Helianthus annuus]|nr:hypothetical protein HanPSC8_Chr07g0306311 [Helianthus annuus]